MSPRTFPAPAALPAGPFRPGTFFEVLLVSYWEIRDALHQLMTRAAAFHDQLMAEDPDWEDLWQCHLELCRIEEYFRWRQDQ